eukprot:6171865-Pleurochrysis_carterae.AAC.1
MDLNWEGVDYTLLDAVQVGQSIAMAVAVHVRQPLFCFFAEWTHVASVLLLLGKRFRLRFLFSSFTSQSGAPIALYTLCMCVKLDVSA